METAQVVLEFIQALVWPATTAFGIWIFRQPLTELIARLQRAELPGGGTLDFGRELQSAQALSLKVSTAIRSKQEHNKPNIPLTEANARMLSLGLQPSPSGLETTRYSALAAQDPNLALAGLRMEVEILVRNLAKGFDVSFGQKDSLQSITRSLKDSGSITNEQYQLMQKIVKLCNAAIHGRNVSQEEAESVIDIADTLADQYLAWLTWGFSK